METIKSMTCFGLGLPHAPQTNPSGTESWEIVGVKGPSGDWKDPKQRNLWTYHICGDRDRGLAT